MSTTDTFGIFQVNKQTFAVDVNAVSEVVPFQDVSPLISSQTCVIGGFNRRGWVIPVISLEAYVEITSTTRREYDIIVILSFADTLIGIAIDQVVGMFNIDLNTIGRFSSYADRGVFAGSFYLELIQSTVTMLNHEVLFADTSLPFIASPNTTALCQEQETKGTVQPETLMLVTVGERMLAFNARSIFSTLSSTNVETGYTSSPCYLGETAHLGKKIPVLDLACLIFGQPSNLLPKQRPTIFININEHQIGFSVDSIVEVFEVDSQQAIKKPVQAFSGHNWFSSLYPFSAFCTPNANFSVAHNQPLIMEVDTDYLANNHVIQGVVSLCRSEDPQASESQLISNNEQHRAIYYDMGTEILCDLDDIVEIAPANIPIIPLSDNGYLCGMMLLHDKSVAVYDFRPLFLANRNDHHTESEIEKGNFERILVLRDGKDTFGIRVNRLLDIVSYSIPNDSQDTTSHLSEEGAESAFITVSFYQNEKKRYTKLTSTGYLKQYFNS